MRDLSHLDQFRVLDGDRGDSHNGAFIITIKGEDYKVIASNGFGWEHVSVSHRHKIPSWRVMCAVKELFFDPEEVVMQLHPAKSQYVNDHPNCLHLWRPTKEPIPTPPKWMV